MLQCVADGEGGLTELLCKASVYPKLAYYY